MKRLTSIVLLTLIAFLSAGCVWGARVPEGTKAICLEKGTTASRVLGPGRYFPADCPGQFSRLAHINVAEISAVFTDLDLVTYDKQPIGIEIHMSFRRWSDDESLMTMYRTFTTIAVNDDALTNEVLGRSAHHIKDQVTPNSLDEMIGTDEAQAVGRTLIASNIKDALAPVLAEIGVEITFVGIKNITVDQAYLDGLKAKSQAQIGREIEAENAATERQRANLAVDLAAAKTLEIQAQLETEKANTDISLEIARREKLVAKEQNEVWRLSPEAFELERIRLMMESLDETDKIYFVPEGQNISIYLGMPPLR